MKLLSVCMTIGFLLAGGVIGYEVLRPALGTPAPASPTPSVLVTEFRLTPGSMPVTFTGYGSIRPGADGEMVIAPPAGGILRSLAVTQGQRVTAGQKLATVDPDAGSVLDAEKAASAVAVAKSNFTHVSALLAARLATAADVSVAAQTLRDAQAALAGVRATGTGMQRRLDAPFGGIVTAVLATPGMAFTAGTPLLRIALAAGLVACVGLPPDQAAQLATGDPVAITLLDTGGSLIASVAGIGAVLDPQTGLLPVQIAANANAVLNAPVEAVITARKLPGFVVPRDSVQTDDAGDFVYQVDAQNIAHRITVHVLVKKNSEQTLLAAGIGTKMPVVVAGAAQLADGMAVRTAP